MRTAMYIASVVLVLIVSGCSHPEKDERYQGRLEAEKIRLASRLAGTIVSYEISEGAAVTTGQVLARIDTNKLKLGRRQQVAQLAELTNQMRSVRAQIDQAQTNLSLVAKQLERTGNLLKKGAVTEGAYDEIVTKKKSLEQQIEALEAQYQAFGSKKDQINAAIAATDLSIADADIASPVSGTILNSYFHAGEFVGAGAPVAEIANLDTMTVKVHVPLRVLPRISSDTRARVYLDGVSKPFAGTVTWISEEAEFTPKTILTRETRDTLVYAVEIGVANPKRQLKIGMPVEVIFGN